MTHGTCIAMLSALLAVSVGSSHADDALSTGLSACAKLGDNLERLTCYDRLNHQLQAAAHTSPPASTAASSFGSTPVASVPLSAAAPDMFGARPAETAAPPPGVTRTELKSIKAHVTSLRESQRIGTIVDLDNGQKWQQVGHEELLLKVGDNITISRGGFSSFWLMTPGNRVAHVKRLL